MQYFLGIDIGGTFIKVGVIGPPGKLIDHARIPSGSGCPPGQVIEALAACIGLLTDRNRLQAAAVRGIGVGCPGSVDDEKGVICYAPNLDWENVPFVSMLSAKLSKGKPAVPIRLCNDADAAALAERFYGAGRNYNDFVLLTVGTGIGSGIVIGGKLHRSVTGGSSEIGHMLLHAGGRPCACGLTGCFETYASLQALKRDAETAASKCPESLLYGRDLDAQTVWSCAEEGDATAQKVMKQYIGYLSMGILNICNVLRPQAVMLGGGLSHLGQKLAEKVQKILAENRYGYRHAPPSQICIASLGNHAGMIGAAALLSETM